VTLDDAIRAAARAYLYGVLRETNGNVAAAAKRAGVDRTRMYRLFPKYGLKLIGGGVLVDVERSHRAYMARL